MTDVEKINLDNIIARLLEGLFFSFFFGMIIEYGPLDMVKSALQKSSSSWVF